MSTHWNFECIDHPDAHLDRGLNHGEETLRDVWKLRNELAALREADSEGGIELEHWMWGHHGEFGSVYHFIAAHKDCNVVLRNEYGDEEPIEGDPCIATLYVGKTYKAREVVVCQRGTHTSGKHRFKKDRVTVEWEG